MIVFNDPQHGEQIGVAAGVIFSPYADTCIANTISGELAGGVIYQGYNGASAGIHVAAFHPNWLSKDLLWVVFDYPFNQLKIKKLFSTICETNVKALEFNRKLGFKLEAIVPEYYPDGAMYLTSLARDECRWLTIQPRTIKRGTTNGFEE